MRIVIIPTQNALKLHFDRIARAISDGTLRAGGDNQIVVILACALLNRANHIFPDIAAQPLINGGNLTLQSLKLIDAHGADLKNGVGQEVLNTLLCAGQLLPVCLATSSILERSIRHKLH